MSDRVVVMRERCDCRELFRAPSATQQQIMSLALGHGTVGGLKVASADYADVR